MKVVFVAGLTHSGSTVLDMLLGGHSELVGLGEAASLVCQKPAKLIESDRRCSCGNRLADCVFWSEVLKRLRNDAAQAPAQRYNVVLRVFKDVFGAARIPVDSSKSLSTLRLVSAASNIDLRVIHLIRDVRAWTVSHLDVDRRQRAQGMERVRAENPGRLWLYYLRKLSLVRFAIWHRGNRQIERYLGGTGRARLEVSYEGLALDGQQIVADICTFLGVRQEPLLAQLASTSSHVALGNPMRLDAGRRAAVRYDHRWLTRREWVLASLLMPHVMTYNDAHVYHQSGSRRRDASKRTEGLRADEPRKSA